MDASFRGKAAQNLKNAVKAQFGDGLILDGHEQLREGMSATLKSLGINGEVAKVHVVGSGMFSFGEIEIMFTGLSPDDYSRVDGASKSGKF